MNLKNKKTVLNDEAAIYSHKQDATEKEKWQGMSKKERWQYIKDYYLMRAIVTLIIIISVVSIVKTMLEPKPEVLLSVAVVDDFFNEQTYEDLQAQFDALLGLDPETQETFFDTGYSLNGGNYQYWQKFSIYNAVGEIDVTLIPLSLFQEYATGGFFSPVAGHLPTDLYMALSEYMLEVPQKDEQGNPIPDSETVYGICVDSSWVFEGQERVEPFVLAFNAAPKNVDNAEKFIRFLFFPDDVK